MIHTRAHIKGLGAVIAALLLIALPTLGADASIARQSDLQQKTPQILQSKRHQTLVKLAKGKFLVARRGMKDLRFAQTVILLVEYGSQGAGGLIINRPTPVNASEIVRKMKPGKLADGKVYIGGPVQPDLIVMLMRAQTQPEGSLYVFDDIYMTSREETFLNAASDDRIAAASRLYAGYAGWAPLQLEKEMFHNDWYVTDADADIIFNADPEKIWPTLMRKLAP